MNTTEIKSRPILFSGEMVKAILRGDKTQTRRVIKPQPDWKRAWYDHGHWSVKLPHGNSSERSGNCGVSIGHPESQSGEWEYMGRFSDGMQYPLFGPIRCPYGKPGDRLWVRETTFRDGDELYYRADGDCCDQIPECACCEVGKPKCKPSIFMPRDDCRITLEVTDVRVERVREISEEDVDAEGLSVFQFGSQKRTVTRGTVAAATALGFLQSSDKITERELLRSGAAAFAGVAGWIGSSPSPFPKSMSNQQLFSLLWDSINAKRDGGIYSWESNPWVWVVDFKRVETD